MPIFKQISACTKQTFKSVWHYNNKLKIYTLSFPAFSCNCCKFELNRRLWRAWAFGSKKSNVSVGGFAYEGVWVKGGGCGILNTVACPKKIILRRLLRPPKKRNSLPPKRKRKDVCLDDVFWGGRNRSFYSHGLNMALKAGLGDDFLGWRKQNVKKGGVH